MIFKGGCLRCCYSLGKSVRQPTKIWLMLRPMNDATHTHENGMKKFIAYIIEAFGEPSHQGLEELEKASKGD